MSSPASSTNEPCQCESQRTGPAEGANCPDCGQQSHPRVSPPTVPGSAVPAPHPRSKNTGIVMSVIALAMGVANSIYALSVMDWLTGGGFLGGFAGVAMLYPPALWLFVQVPFAIVTTPILFHGTSQHEDRKIRTYGCTAIGIGILGSFIFIVISTIWILNS